MKITPEVVSELEVIRRAHQGKLRPADALEQAQKGGAKSPLYNLLSEKGLWDDSQAAQFGRLEFVRTIITRVRVTVKTESGKPQRIRAYVSPLDERTAGGGYISVTEVLDSDARKRKMLETALRELRSFQRKYSELQELFGIFEDIDGIEEALKAA